MAQVTPAPGLASTVAVGGTAVQAAGPTQNGIIIVNPASAADQGLANTEPLYVNPIASPGGSPGDGNGSTFVLQPGQSWSLNFGQTTNTYVNAASNGHKFSIIVF